MFTWYLSSTAAGVKPLFLFCDLWTMFRGSAVFGVLIEAFSMSMCLGSIRAAFVNNNLKRSWPGCWHFPHLKTHKTYLGLYYERKTAAISCWINFTQQHPSRKWHFCYANSCVQYRPSDTEYIMMVPFFRANLHGSVSKRRIRLEELLCGASAVRTWVPTQVWACLAPPPFSSLTCSSTY